MIKNLQKLTMNSMVAYSQLLFFLVKIIQVKDKENDTTNVCFFLNLRKIKLIHIEETLYLVDHFIIWERPNVE